MLQIKIEKSFKKDLARDKKSGQYSEDDFDILKSLIIALQNNETISQKYKRHPLKGKMKNIESIHVKNDWLMVFRIDQEYLNLIMLGKHTQVYKKFK